MAKWSFSHITDYMEICFKTQRSKVAFELPESGMPTSVAPLNVLLILKEEVKNVD